MDACDHRTELITKRMIAGTIYPPHFARSTSCFYGMRLASPSTKVEFEYYYLTKSDFKFKTPRDLETFLDRLSVNQQSLLRSFTFDLFAKWNIVDPRDWAAVFTRLPSNLISIQFSLYSANLSAFKTDGHWFIWDHGTLTVHRAARLLEMLGKRARRYAARAKIGLSDCCLDPKDIARMREHIAQGRDEVVGVLHDLEPWSENWLGWWEESTKIDMDNG